ncbi:hypothetical protein GCM10028806_33680 [Spirosoma terrae]|uniref:Uncharacterized protein n=1 Tax=Spirosoma terrae TaxID=1968276 RepID=A0A6L9L5L5_9BACT|nr:hypothetical protein [Spirosoma terrae]NDU95680.1 hypothetical protein [Spirosoma terrae]
MEGLTLSPAPQDQYPLEDWKYEVANNQTQLGYRDWVESCLERDTFDNVVDDNNQGSN